MNLAFAVMFWMIGEKLNMGTAYYLCIIVFTLLHISLPRKEN